MGIAVAVFGWRPHEFWQSTPHEFWSAVEVKSEKPED
jgi:hypothetical protein